VEDRQQILRAHGRRTPGALICQRAFHHLPSTARAEGEALPTDEALAYTSRARGERKRPSAGLEAASGIEPLYRVLQTPDEEEQDPS
jgi:hypothetical protein